MFSLLSKYLRKMVHGIIINPCNVVLFMTKLFIYLFIYLSVVYMSLDKWDNS